MEDQRPAAAIGHVSLRVTDVAGAARFYESLGMRPVWSGPNMAILELRGGTHLMLFRARGKPRKGPVRSFDLMVDDLDAFTVRAAAHGVAILETGSDKLSGHRWATIADADGHVLTVFSSHVEGRTV